jgi:uncharacterized membrane protein (UPF0136 family)
MSSKILISALLLLAACAPKITERVYETPNKTFTTHGTDTRLNLRLREQGESPPDLVWRGTVSTAEYFAQAENFMKLGENTGKPALREKGLAWIRHFYQVPETTLKVDMAYSPFINLAASQAQTQVHKSLDEVLLVMEYAKPVVLAHVLAQGKKMPPTSKVGFEGLLNQAEVFTQLVLADIPNIKLPAVVEEGFSTELVKATEPIFADLRLVIDELRAVKTLSQLLTVVESTVVKFKVTLEPDTLRSMTQGRKLGQDLDQLRDSQDALSLIVDVWAMLTPQERLEKIKPANNELYTFLSHQDSKELGCLKTRGCLGGLIDGVVKKVFILPKIENYGVGNIKRELNQQTMDYVLSTIATMAEEYIKTLPQTFVENIDVAWTAKLERMKDVREDLGPYVTRVAGVWSKKILPSTDGKVAGFETNRIDVSANPRAELYVKAHGKAYELSGEVAGAAMGATATLLNNTQARDSLGFRTALSQISKLVAFSGYRNTHNKIVPALLSPVNHTGKLLDITNFEEAKDPRFSFRVPDLVNLKDPFVADPRLNYEKDFSVAGLAAQIKGLSQSLRFTADWKKSSFDYFLTPMKAQDLTQDANDPALQQSLFPKDMLFALNVGTVSVLLQDLIKKSTPIFMLTLEDKLMWADQYGDSKETAIMAGAVNIKNGQRSNEVSSRDVAQLILGLSEFIENLDGVEETRSPLLLTKNIHGNLPLEAVVNGKRDLSKLIIALSNFLSAKMKTPQSLVLSTYALDRKKIPSNSVIRVDTQAVVARALLKAYRLSGIEAYLWSAQEIYFAMNKNLYSVKNEFYVNSDGTELSFPEKVNTLRALS